MRFRPWQATLIALGLCSVTLVATNAYRARKQAGYEWLFQRLPTDHALIAGIDVAELRRAGLLDLLAGPRINEEVDYRSFVDRIGFDYRTDLDYVAMSIGTTDGARHFVLKGRFDWDTLFAAAQKSGGKCLNAFCDLPGNAAGRNLSFLPLGRSTLGVSVSTGNQAAWILSRENTDLPVSNVPAYPLFLSMDAGLLSSATGLPQPFQPLLQTLSAAEGVVLGLTAADGNLQFVLDANCLSEANAQQLRTTLHHTVESPETMAGLLSEGTLKVEGRMLHGRWPVERSVLEGLISQ